MRGLGRHYELQVTCAGVVDPATGYLIDIKTIDRAVRDHALPIIARACSSDAGKAPTQVLADFVPDLANGLPGFFSAVRWKLDPYYSLEMNTKSPDRVLLRQKFDFAAAHRLHIASLSDEENRTRFGKCNNASGHGHNYQFEPCVTLVLDASGNTPFSLQDLERLVQSAIIDRFDHKHLNTDTTEFSADGGVNPSVENISRVFYSLLADAINGEGKGASLSHITVWETDRTSCTYPAL